MKNYTKTLIILVITANLISCADILDSPPFAELSPENVLTNEAGIEALLASSYQFQYFGGGSKEWVNISECMTDLALVREGGEAGLVAPFANWIWDFTHPWINGSIWQTRYRSIREANLVIANIDGFEGSNEVRARLLAEARYLRASAYAMLYNYFGPVVLRTEPSEAGDKERATDEEMLAFIEAELEAAVLSLPLPGNLPTGYEYGRATQGSALAFLTKHYLNTRQWVKAAETAQRIIDLNYYQLFPDFSKLFLVENEGNREVLVPFVSNNLRGGYQNNWYNGAMTQDFLRSPKIPNFEAVLPVALAWPTNFSVRDWVSDSFEENDVRKVFLVEEYIAINGETRNYRNQRTDNARNMKFFDQNAQGNWHGNDFPYIRFADILLSRSEALNEMNGLNPESFNLLNQVRARAGLSPISMADVSSSVEFRDLILQERVWEFLSEGKRREDLLRHDLLVSNAQARGINNASEHRKLFPIPQNEADNNKLIEQNEGY